MISDPEPGGRVRRGTYCWEDCSAVARFVPRVGTPEAVSAEVGYCRFPFSLRTSELNRTARRQSLAMTNGRHNWPPNRPLPVCRAIHQYLLCSFFGELPRALPLQFFQPSMSSRNATTSSL